MRKFLVFAAGLLALAAPSVRAAGPAAGYGLVEAHDRRVYDAIAPAVVGITCKGPKGGFFGTGVVISPDGLVLTSTTVVPADGTAVKVFFQGAVMKEAKLVGVDEGTESSLLKVEGQGMVFVPLADSAAARPGDLAYTFGNPFGTLSSDDKVSFSAGHVSGIYKLVENGDFQSKYHDLVIETEAAVNPGSDGGPLVDGQGRLLGVISLGFSERRWLGAVVPVHLIAPKLEATRGLKPPAEHLKLPELLSRREAAWRAAVERVAPAVVQVLVDREEKPPPRPRGELSYPQQVEETRKRYLMRPAGPASGVLIDAEGHVLTSWFHVTGKVKSVRIRLADGKTLPAKVLGRDESLDLVMLQAENPGEKLPFAQLADSDVEVGAQLAVLGRSEDPASVTVNRGLVSSKSRAGGRTAQISAFVNYGNLGGPAITVDGKLAGVTGHLRPGSMWGQNSGVGFITPAHVLKATTADLAAGKTLKAPPRTFLGVAPGPDSPEVLGAPVGRVLANSGAAAAGLKPSDLITHLDGIPVEGWQGLVRNITGRKPGDKVKLTVKRKDEKLDFEVVLGQSNE